MKKIGLAGCGAWGSNILRDLILLGSEVFVADTNGKARARALESGAVLAVDKSDDLPDCDGYIVAVPIPDLTPVCASLLQRKKPIFAEKTLCLSADDCDLLERSGGLEYVFAMHKWHYHPGIEALRVLAGSGEIGVLKQINTTRHAWVDDFHGGDVFWTQAVHDLTIIKHILGYIPDAIKAVNIINDESGLPVNLTAIIGERPVVLLSVSGRHPDKQSGVSIYGSKGSADLHNAYDDHIRSRTARGEKKIRIDTKFPLYLELKEFLDYLDGGEKPRCGLRDAREVTEAILRLRRSGGVE